MIARPVSSHCNLRPVCYLSSILWLELSSSLPHPPISSPSLSVLLSNSRKFIRGVGMASSSSPCLCLLLVATASIVVGAVNEYKVGDGDGWRVPAENDPGFYETWASKIQFLAGDSILFEYKNDSVVKVTKRGYYHCNETKQGSTFREGSTVFLLDKPGFYYFVSGDLEHCKKGQRLMVEVVGVPVPLPLVPSPSPLPSAAVSSTISSLLTAFAIGTWCLSLGFIHFSRLF